MRKNMLRGSSRSVEYLDYIYDGWAATSHNVSLASLTFSAGDLVFCSFQTHSGGTASGTPSGWTLLSNQSVTGHDWFIYYRRMDGTETLIAFTGSSGTRNESATIFSLRNAKTPTGSNIDYASGTPPDAPVVPMTASKRDIVIAMAGSYISNASNDITAGPSGYTTIRSVYSWNGSYGHVGDYAYKLEPAAAENPGACTSSGVPTSARGVTLLIEAA